MNDTYTKNFNVEAYEIERVSDKQDFVYPYVDKEFKIDKLWENEEVTGVIIKMMSEFMHIFLQLTPFQQKIVSILVIEPAIPFCKLIKKGGKSRSWTYKNFAKIAEYEPFQCILPKGYKSRTNK